MHLLESVSCQASIFDSMIFYLFLLHGYLEMNSQL